MVLQAVRAERMGRGLKKTFVVGFILFLMLSACNLAAPNPFVTPTPAPTPTPTFPPAKFGSIENDVTYCTPNGLPQKMDVYYPQSGGPWPALVYVHGGSWYQGDKSDGVGWGRLTEQGFLVVSVNYRLGAYNIKFPAMIEDVKCAVRYLRAHARDYNIDPARIGAIGASAGGHLVDLLGTTDVSAGWDTGEYADQSSRVQAVVSMAGPADLTLHIPNGLNSSISFAFGELAGTDSPRMVAASPVTYVTPDDPPFLLLHGDKDGVVPPEQSKALDAKLKAAGVRSILVIVQNGDHGLQGYNGVATVPSQDEISQTILDFLVKYLK